MSTDLSGMSLVYERVIAVSYETNKVSASYFIRVRFISKY